MYKLTLKDVMEEVGIKNSPDFFAHIKVKNKPMAHQLEMARKYASSKRWGDWGEPGCVSGDTEFLTPDGWKRIDEYEEGDQVAQWDEGKNLGEFVEPIRYVVSDNDKFLVFKLLDGSEQVVCYDHMMWVTYLGKTRKLRSAEVMELPRDQVKLATQSGEHMKIKWESILTVKVKDSEDGKRYCFQVPSGLLILRYSGREFITGNCGKTLPAHLHGILMASLGNKVVYTMPPKLIEQFEEEMLEWFIGIGHHLKIQRMNHPAAKKRQLISEFEKSGWPDILLMSYDGYREFNDVNKTKKIGSNQWYHDDGSRWTAESGRAPYTKDGRKVSKSGKAENDKHLLLNKRGYNVFFFDEAHALCGLDSIISKSVEETAKGNTAIYLMTGTPVPTTITDAYGLIRLINPEAYVSQSAFERKHIVYRNQMIPHPRFKGRTMTIKVPERYIGTEEIMEHLYAKATRVQKRDIHDMPEPIITDVKVKLSGPHAKLYKDVINNQFAIMGDVILAPEHSSQVRHMALQLISCPTVFNPEVPMKNELFLRTQELLDSINPHQNKVIVFAYYKAAIEFLQQEFAQYNPAVLYGETVNGHAEVTKFKTDDSCRMIILNWLSGGAGLNLQVASHIVFYECPTSPKDAKQAIARSDRTGQQNLVNVYFMRVLGTLSDRDFKKLLTAGEDVNRVVNDRHDLLHEVLKK